MASPAPPGAGPYRLVTRLGVIGAAVGVCLAAAFGGSGTAGWFHQRDKAPAAKCPLGYGVDAGGPLPAGHPPVARDASHVTQPGGRDVTQRTTSPAGLTLFHDLTAFTADDAAPTATAFAVDSAGVLTCVGSVADCDSPAVAARVSLGGRFVIPGFVDSHVHLLSGGLGLAPLDTALRAARSTADFSAAVAAAAKDSDTAGGGWVVGGGWDETGGGGWPLPTAALIESVAPGLKAVLVRSDGHAGVASFAALAAAGLSSFALPPPGASSPSGLNVGIEIEIDGETGEPSGIVREAALGRCLAVVPPETDASLVAALARATQHLHAHGVTALADFGRVQFGAATADGFSAAAGARAWTDLESVIDAAHNVTDTALRVAAYVPLSTWRRAAERRRAEEESGLHRRGSFSTARLGGVKAFADGTLGSRTALLRSEYADAPGRIGAAAADPALMAAAASAASAAGLQVAIHAIGDAAVDRTVALLAGLGGRPGPGHRVEHAQHVSGEPTAAAVASAGLVASVQPVHMIADAAILSARLGRDRAQWAWPLGSLRRAGVALALGSDWPVAPIDPLGNLGAAVFRCRPNGLETRGLESDGLESGARGSGGGASCVPLAPAAQQLAMVDALYAATRGAASASGLESVGCLSPGRLADFVVLSADVLESPASVFGARVVKTFVSGRCVHGC